MKEFVARVGGILEALQHREALPDSTICTECSESIAHTVRPKALEKTTPNSARNVCDLSRFLIKLSTISNDLLHQLLV